MNENHSGYRTCPHACLRRAGRFDFRLFVLLAALPTGLANADVVQCVQQRVEGKMALAGEAIKVGDKAIPWGDVVFFVRDPVTRALGAPQGLRMTSGEVWGVEVGGGTTRHVRVRSSLLGERQIDANLVSEILFDPASPPSTDLKPRTLYRPAAAEVRTLDSTGRDNQGVPGDLLAINEDRVVLNTPLGVLTLPREGLGRYVLNALTLPGEAAEDELRLIDGSTFRGKIAPKDGGLELQHAVLGRVEVPVESVRAVLRHPPSVAYITEFPKDSVKTFCLARKGAAPQSMECPTDGASSARSMPCVRAIRILPKTEIRYRLPGQAGKKLKFRASLGCIDGAQGAVKVRVTAAGRTLYDQELPAEAGPTLLNVDVSGGEELLIEVDFAGRIAFPAGVVLGDPHSVEDRP